MTSPTIERVPAAEVTVDSALVQALLREQHPDLADLPIAAADSGWDNALFRLGPDLAVRLPRRELGAKLIVHEQTWLPLLAPQLPLPTPAPLRLGVAGCGYPWKWSVVPWLHGIEADLSRPDAAQAEPLAAFLRALHRPGPPTAPYNEYRGVPLQQRAPVIEERISRFVALSGGLHPRLRQLWEHALAAAPCRTATWLHGDLHSRNVLCIDCRISGILDWGDLCVGDCATDLGALWTLLDEPAARERAMSLYGADVDSWARARGWALALAVLLAGMQDPADARYRAIGETTLQNLIAGP